MEMLKKLVLLLIIQLISDVQSFFPTNEFCKPYETVFPVDHPHYKYTTFFMKLEQCQGADGTPNVGTGRVCKPSKIENMNISVYNVNGVKTIQVPKHLECTFGCKDDSSICNKYQTWEEDTCSCKCPDITPTCGEDQEWRRHQCSCVCTEEKRTKCNELGKAMDSNSCECIPVGKSRDELCSGTLASEYVVIIMLIELVVIIAIVFILYRKFIYRSNLDKPETERLKGANACEENGTTKDISV